MSTSKTVLLASTSILLASAAFAQEFYLGGSVSRSAMSFETRSTSYEGDVDGFAVFAGARMPLQVGAPGVYWGGELEAAVGTGYSAVVTDPDDDFEDKQQTIQAELHLGYELEKFRLYAFVGTGKNEMNRNNNYSESNLSIYGIGAEFDISDNIALRVESEMSSMTVDACNTFDPVESNRISLGCLVKF